MSQLASVFSKDLTDMAGSDVGVWDYDVVNDRCSGCATFAMLYGLPPEKVAVGVPLSRIAETIHPADREQAKLKRLHMLEHGGLFVQAFRTLSPDNVCRWLIGIGRYVKDGDGRVRRGRGIIIDVTAFHTVEGSSGLRLFDIPENEMDRGAPIDRAVAHAIAVHQAIQELSELERRKLAPVLDSLLMHLGQILSSMLEKQGS